MVSQILRLALGEKTIMVSQNIRDGCDEAQVVTVNFEWGQPNL